MSDFMGGYRQNGDSDRDIADRPIMVRCGREKRVIVKETGHDAEAILESIDAGEGHDAILRRFPGITSEDVNACALRRGDHRRRDREPAQEPEPTPEHREFDTGARRSRDADGTRYDLISPIALEAVAATYAEGSAKYGDHNWERGMPVHDLLNHALRHIFKYLSGDLSEPHLPHAAWGLLAAIHSEALWPHLNAPHTRGPGCTLTPEMHAEIERFRAARAAS